jgi:Tfp pilus assembly pilus retraction ATPase PilT
MANAMGVSIAFRKIYPPLWSGENLFFNDALLSSLLDFEDGIVVVAGKPGSGKTTLVNAMLNHVNQNAYHTIVTLENPIETFHTPTRASIIQLQRGVHFFDYEEAAAIAIKSCADLIMVDELRDGQTCRACFESARSGLLSVATISAGSCREAFDRILHLCGLDTDDPYTFFLLTSIRRIIHLTPSPNPEEETRTTLELVELSQAVEKFKAELKEEGKDSIGTAGDRTASIAGMIDAVFDAGTKREAGASG